MSTHVELIDYQLAKETSARYAREAARAQVAYDLKIYAAIGEELIEGEMQLYAERDWRQLAFCKMKAREYAALADRLHPKNAADVAKAVREEIVAALAKQDFDA